MIAAVSCDLIERDDESPAAGKRMVVDTTRPNVLSYGIENIGEDTLSVKDFSKPTGIAIRLVRSHTRIVD